MSTAKYLDYSGLKHFYEKLQVEFAPIAALQFKETVADIEHLPALSGLKAGWMYNVTEGGEMDERFVEEGRVLGDGENVAVVELITGFTAVPAASVTEDKDPKKLDWYELDGTEYVPSEDRIADTLKTYYTADTIKKFDALGGVFDLEGRYLEFGKEFPENPEDERVFLYMGEDTFTYDEVVDPSGRPVDEGWYELVDVYNEVTPVGDEDPSAEGWYEEDGAGGYQLTADISVQVGKDYFVKEEEYVLTADVVVDPNKTYYEKNDQYKTGVIYEYSDTEGDWIAKSGSASGDMTPITNKEIDDLFI